MIKWRDTPEVPDLRQPQRSLPPFYKRVGARVSCRTPNHGPALSRRPLRADAQRKYDKLLEAAREAFAEDGSAATLDDIARRAGVGIATLYRHFPTRQHLLEAVYVDEVEAMARRRPTWPSCRPGSARHLAARIRRLRRDEARPGRGAARLRRHRRRGLPGLPHGRHRRGRHAARARPEGRESSGPTRISRRRAHGRRHRGDPQDGSPSRSSACSRSCSTGCATPRGRSGCSRSRARPPARGRRSRWSGCSASAIAS